MDDEERSECLHGPAGGAGRDSQYPAEKRQDHAQAYDGVVRQEGGYSLPAMSCSWSEELAAILHDEGRSSGARGVGKEDTGKDVSGGADDAPPFSSK